MATTTTSKHDNFVANPLEDAVLRDLPGIGEEMEKRLQAANIKSPKTLLGKYLVRAGWHASGRDESCIDASLFHAVGWRNIACQKLERPFLSDFVIH